MKSFFRFSLPRLPLVQDCLKQFPTPGPENGLIPGGGGGFPSEGMVTGAIEPYITQQWYSMIILSAAVSYLQVYPLMTLLFIKNFLFDKLD